MQTARFNRVLAAEGVSNFGSMLSRLAIPWLAALQLQATPAQMAALLVADVVAAGLGALVLGPWVDRRAKRGVMLLADALRALVLGALAVLAWMGLLTMPLLVLAAAASGVLTVAFEMARSAWTAQCVPVDELPRRNAQLSVAGSVSEALAFAGGGWLFQAAGAVVALLVDGASYLLSALCLRGVPPAPPVLAEKATRPRHSPWRAAWREATAGLRVVAATPRLRALCGVHALLEAAVALTGTSFMIYVSRDLALPTGPLGMIFATGALGAIAGASLAPRLGRLIGPGRTMTLGLALFALGLALVPLATGAGWFAIGLLVGQQLVGDTGHVLHDVHDRSLRQTAVPADLLARADAGVRSVGHAATLLGAWVGGVLGTAQGARSVLWLACTVALVAALWAGVRLAERTRPGPAAG